MKHCLILLMVSGMILAAFCAVAAAEQSVTVSASALVRNGDTVAAQAAALQEAKDKAFRKTLAQYMDVSDGSDQELVDELCRNSGSYFVSCDIVKTRAAGTEITVFVRCLIDDVKLQADVKKMITAQRKQIKKSGRNVNVALAVRVRGVDDAGTAVVEALNTYGNEFEAAGFRVVALDRDDAADAVSDEGDFRKAMCALAKNNPAVNYLVAVDIIASNFEINRISGFAKADAKVSVAYYAAPFDAALATYGEQYSWLQNSNAEFAGNLARKCAGNNVKRCIGDLTKYWNDENGSKPQPE